MVRDARKTAQAGFPRTNALNLRHFIHELVCVAP
jgi:hypothetical protein